jgi:hypothetical protein
MPRDIFKAAALLVVLWQPAALADSIESVDWVGPYGSTSSLALDSSGNPVVSYLDAWNFDLKVLHCNDPNCSGGDESIVRVDDMREGSYSSLALDSSGNPVVSYRGRNDVKILHCNDPNCVGGDESIESVDTGGSGSLALDINGYPVVSYSDSTNGLKVLHCNDVNCSGGDESIESVDYVGRGGSLALDSSGNPVVSYLGAWNFDLKVLHCNDPNCSGRDESIVSVDTDGGRPFSLALDSSGNPVVSISGYPGGLKVRTEATLPRWRSTAVVTRW